MSDYDPDKFYRVVETETGWTTEEEPMDRPDVLIGLKHAAKRMYENGYDSTLDCIEETIVELERLRATVQGLKRENDHLRAMNKRVIEALSEIAPLQAMYIKHEDTGETCCENLKGKSCL